MSLTKPFGCGVALALATVVSAGPIIGGTPVHTEDDVFAGGLWTMDVSSYVYDSDSDLPAGFALSGDEFLFIYVLDVVDTSEVSVNSFSVGNPNDVPITSVGFSTDIVPAGLNDADREDPFLFGYSGPSQSSIFTYTGDFGDPFSTIDPGEWSFVWYIAEAMGWSPGSATGAGGGSGATEFVPVPVPAPGAISLLALAGVAMMRRTRRG